MEALNLDTSIETLVDTITSGPVELREQALKLLAPKCIDARKRLYAKDHIQVLVEAVKAGPTFFAQLYAFDAVSWAAEDNGGVTKEEMQDLRPAVRDPTLEELTALSKSLDDGTSKEKDEAALVCACLGTLASFKHFNQLDDSVLRSLVNILSKKKGSDNQKLWAAYSLSNLASCEVYRMRIVNLCSIGPLVTLVRNGTEGQKQWAALALGNLADNYGVHAEIRVEGGIPALVTLSRSEISDHQWAAAYTLAAVAVLDDNRSKIASKNGIPPLVNMVKSGSAKHKRWAANALGTIAADNDFNREEIVKEGAIPALVAMVQSGTEDEQLWAAYALGNLACDSTAVKAAIHSAGVTTALAGLQANQSEVVRDAGALALTKVRQYGKVRQFLSRLGIS